MPRSDGKKKICSKCRQRKWNREFPACRAAVDGLHSWCRKCTATARDACVARRKAMQMPSYAASECRRLRLAVLRKYSDGPKPRCACCREDRIEFLSLDHINGGGAAHRKSLGNNQMVLRELRRLGYPPGYRVLCHNCNQAIGAYGYCPHRRLRKKS